MPDWLKDDSSGYAGGILIVAAIVIVWWLGTRNRSRTSTRKAESTETTEKKWSSLWENARGAISNKLILIGIAALISIGIVGFAFTQEAPSVSKVKQWSYNHWLHLATLSLITLALTFTPYVKKMGVDKAVRITLLVMLGLYVIPLSWIENPPWQGGGVRVAVPMSTGTQYNTNETSCFGDNMRCALKLNRSGSTQVIYVPYRKLVCFKEPPNMSFERAGFYVSNGSKPERKLVCENGPSDPCKGASYDRFRFVPQQGSEIPSHYWFTSVGSGC